jgi:hypothetical protein
MVMLPNWPWAPRAMQHKWQMGSKNENRWHCGKLKTNKGIAVSYIDIRILWSLGNIKTKIT